MSALRTASISTERVTVILRAATPTDLRHMARELEREAKQMEEPE